MFFHWFVVFVSLVGYSVTFDIYGHLQPILNQSFNLFVNASSHFIAQMCIIMLDNQKHSHFHIFIWCKYHRAHSFRELSYQNKHFEG